MNGTRRSEGRGKEIIARSKVGRFKMRAQKKINDAKGTMYIMHARRKLLSNYKARARKKAEEKFLDGFLG